MTARFTAYSLVIRLMSSAFLLVIVSRTTLAQCPGLGSISFNVVAAPEPTLDFPPGICTGQPATISVNEIFSSYLWSTGSTSSSITVNQGGTYTVTVTNSAGCEGSESAAIVLNTPPQPFISGPSTICQNTPIELSASGGFTSWAWSTGETTSMITVAIAGTYTVTVTDANGCSGTDDFLVTASNAVVQPDITFQPFTCGQVTLNAGGGFATYAWSNGASTQTTNVPQGDYTVTVTDAAGCTGTDVINVIISPPNLVEITGPQSLCVGGTATLTATAGFQNYAWSNGSVVAEITISQSGTYSLTATDVNGCTSQDVVTVVENPSPQPQILGGTTLCNGSSTTLSVNANFPAILWSTGETTPQITVSTLGSIGLQVTDANGCSGTATVEVTEATSLSPQITLQAYACDGQLTLDAGAGYLTYAWSTGGTAQTVVVSQNGNYEVTVSNAGGCTGTAFIDVIIPTQQQVTIAGDLTYCQGTSIVLTASAGFQDYLWSNGPAVAEITVTQPGTYVVTATDANGCTSEDMLTVAENTSPQPQILGGTTICNGSSTTLSISANFPAILWSTGESTPVITVSTTGTIGLQVTDLNGCSGTTSVDVTVSSSLSPQITAQAYACDGQLTLDAGVGYLTYSWSNGGTSQTIVVSQNGSYDVTVSASGGCTGTAVFNVILPAQQLVTISGDISFCTGASSLLTASAGFQNYLWSTGATVAEITVIQTGTYAVTVTDANGCTDTEAINVQATDIAIPAQILGNATYCPGNATTLFLSAPYETYVWSDGTTAPSIVVSVPGLVSVTVSDVGGCTGEASILVTEGNTIAPQVVQVSSDCSGLVEVGVSTTYETYFWSNGGTNQITLVDQTGTYFVTVTDANGCTGVGSIFAQVPQQFSVDIIGATTFCSGDSTVLTATSGFQNYIWSNGATSAEITVSQAGNYTVTVSDVNGCTGSDSFEVTESNAITPSISEGTYNCDGNLILEAPAGYAGYVWSTGSGAPVISVSEDGSYFLTVTDASGCSGTASIIVQVPDEVVVVVQTPPAPICPGDTAQLSVPPGFDSYAWSTGETANAIGISSSGLYAVTVTDQYGCTAEDAYAFNFAETPVFEIIEDVLDCESVEALLELDLVNVNGSASYLWSNGETEAALATIQPGLFSVTVTDANGCTAAQMTEVLQELSFSSFADTIEFVQGQVVALVPPDVDFLTVETLWSPTDILLGCNNCPTAHARPVEDVLINYSAVSVSGCLQEGTFFLFSNLLDQPAVYAPNVFSPDSPFNYGFTLFGNDLLVNINYMRIFSRWGEKMFEAEDLTPGDLSAGWDGTFRGEDVDPGVFVWVAEVVYEDGSSEVLKGDITLIR